MPTGAGRPALRSFVPWASRQDAVGAPLDRRQWLRVGAVSVAGLAGTATARPAHAVAAASSPRPTADSVIVLNMMGGVTHHESFDPKPDAPEDIRGELGAIATRLPGVQFSEALPRLAEIADRFALVRSYSHGSNDHFLSQAHVLCGRVVALSQIRTEPNLGSIVAHVQGGRGPWPGYIAVPGITRPGPPPHNLFVGGWLGAQHDPFCTGGIPEQPDFTARPQVFDPPPHLDERLVPPTLSLLGGLDLDRLAHRAALRRVLDESARAAALDDAARAVDGHYARAFELLESAEVRAAFDLSHESDATRDRYGRTKLGGRCLLARRLVEAGARFVMVDYGYDPDYGNLWDNHNAPTQNHPPIGQMARRPYHVAGLDRAFAALLRDLDERGRLERTLVVFITEFGRTPRVNANGGRDHWGAAGSIFFAGGGTRRGTVIGQTDREGAYPLGRRYGPSQVAATILRALGINPMTRINDRQGRPHFILPDVEPIDELWA